MISLVLGNAGPDELLIHWQPCVEVTTNKYKTSKSNNHNESGKDAVFSESGRGMGDKH